MERHNSSRFQSPMRPSRHINSVRSIDTTSRSFVPGRKGVLGVRVRRVVSRRSIREGASLREEPRLGVEENRITLPCPPFSTIPFHVHAPASRRVAQSPRHPSRCYPRARHRTRAPAATLFARGRADRARELHPAPARASSFRLFPGVPSSGAPRALPAMPPEKSSAQREGKRRCRYRAPPSPRLRPLLRAVARQQGFRVLPQWLLAATRLAPLRRSGSPASLLRRREKRNSSSPRPLAPVLAVSIRCACRAQAHRERQNCRVRFSLAAP